jgi:hypothetical protein
MNREILRNRVPVYNNSGSVIAAERTVNVGKVLLENPTEYVVAVESASIDLSQVIFDPSPDYKIMIFCELKADTTPPAPAGLVYGPNVFSFPGELRTVAEFLRFLQDPLLKKALPFNLGLFDLDGERMFRYTLQSADKSAVFDSGYFRVYFNAPLAKILNGFYNQNLTESYGGETFFEMIPETRTSSVDTLPLLNKMESILISTTLPVTSTSVLNITQNQLLDYHIVGSVEVNNLSYNLVEKSDFRYIPNLLRPYTMTQRSPITQYSLGVLIQYNSGTVRQHYLAPSERFLANLVFTPRGVAE